MSDTVQYAYAVCQWWKNGQVVVERTEILKETAKTVMVKEGLAGYSFNRRLDRDLVCRTFEAAVEAFRKAKQREIDVLTNRVEECRKMLTAKPAITYKEE